MADRDRSPVEGIKHDSISGTILDFNPVISEDVYRIKGADIHILYVNEYGHQSSAVNPIKSLKGWLRWTLMTRH